MFHVLCFLATKKERFFCNCLHKFYFSFLYLSRIFGVMLHEFDEADIPTASE